MEQYMAENIMEQLEQSQCGYIILEKYYNIPVVESLLAESNMLYSDNNIDKYVHNSEQLNGDVRIWNANLYKQCPNISMFANERLFIDLSKLYYAKYNNSYHAKIYDNMHYTMINKLVHDDDVIQNIQNKQKNSGEIGRAHV